MNMIRKLDEEINDEFSSESDAEMDKMIIHAVISAIEGSNKYWVADEESKPNADEADSLKENELQPKRKKLTPGKRTAFLLAEDGGNKNLEDKLLTECNVTGENNDWGKNKSPLEENLDSKPNQKSEDKCWVRNPNKEYQKVPSDKPHKVTNHVVDKIEISQEELDSAQEEVKSKEKSILLNYKWHCTRCPAIVDTTCELRTHHRDAHNQPVVFKCLQCPKVYSRYQSFLTHIKLHYSSKTYDCEICHKRFNQKTVLHSHATVHSNSRPHVCKVCGKAFKQFSSLYCHNKNHLPDKTKFQCTVCDKTYATKRTLELHRKIHTGERNYVCDVCGKSFVARGSLDYHILCHNDVKPYACSCGKAFKTVRLLEKHATLHTGVKPHRCEFCGKDFREKGALREHTRIHTGAMPYTCEFCKKTFRFKGILTVHRRQHTGERPYGCADCKKTFTNWANYNKHMKRRHKNEYNPTNVSGRNKYRPPFLIQNKTTSEFISSANTYHPPEGSSLQFDAEKTNNSSMRKYESQEVTRNHADDPTKNLRAQDNAERGHNADALDKAERENLFGNKDNIKEDFFKQYELLNPLEGRSHRINFRASSQEEDDIFIKTPYTQNYFVADFQPNDIVYSSEVQGNKSRSDSEFVQTPRFLLQNGHDSLLSGTPIHGVPLLYEPHLELSLIPSSIN